MEDGYQRAARVRVAVRLDTRRLERLAASPSPWLCRWRSSHCGVLGAGISGLSAALEAARGGASVLVADMSTVGGGHAILSNGAVSIVGTPLQEQRKIADSPQLAEKDFLARGEDNNRRWVAAYVRDSRQWLYDWLTGLGVTFENLARPTGNTVPRLHLARGKGLGLVEPIYRACVVLKADSLDDLAVAMRVPPESLRVTVSRYNELTTKGIDLDFQAFGEKTFPKPKPIDTPPFYAAQFFPLTSKSMGGIDVDEACRVLDRAGRPVPGLFAVGEVTGFGGINGKAALEGTFLGPGIYMGRIAGGRIAQDLGRTRNSAVDPPATTVSAQASFSDSACLKCHDVARQVKLRRSGYWHYERSHAKALSREYACSSCHADLFPYRSDAHGLDRTSLATYCRACHGVQPREVHRHPRALDRRAAGPWSTRPIAPLFDVGEQPRGRVPDPDELLLDSGLAEEIRGFSLGGSQPRPEFLRDVQELAFNGGGGSSAGGRARV